MGVQPHTLVYTSHDILQLCIILHIGLLPVTQNFVNLLLSLHGNQNILHVAAAAAAAVLPRILPSSLYC